VNCLNDPDSRSFPILNESWYSDAQKHHEQTRRDTINEKFRKAGFLSSEERNAEMDREIEYARQKRNEPTSIDVDKSELEDAVRWNDRHQGNDSGRYQLYFIHGRAKPVLIKPGDRMTAPALIGDLKTILSGEENIVESSQGNRRYSLTLV